MSSTPSATGPLAALPARLARAAGAVLPALEQASRRTGVDFAALFHTARLESSFNPAARAATSSATGLFQFIDATWLSTLAKHGPRHGISVANRAEALALRKDPNISSLMAAEHMADNAARLEAGLGRAARPTDLYLAHFLGAGGALKFLSRMAQTPALSAAELLPAAARANRSIFFSGGTARSLQQVHDLLARRFIGADRPEADIAPSGPQVPIRVSATGTDVPENRPDAALPIAQRLSPALAAMLASLETRAPATGLLPPDRPIDPRHAAQAAYLLLAELGG